MSPTLNLRHPQRGRPDDRRLKHFFVSFTQADRPWATWIAWTLEEAGYAVFFQDWDFTGNFVLEMDRAHIQSHRTLAVLSPDYLASRFAAPEWAARFAEDATSAHDRLIPIRVRPCQLQGLLAQIVYLDLVGCGEPEARQKLLDRVAGIRLKPEEPPLFPGPPEHEAITDRPAFPARAPVGTREYLAPAADRRVPPWLIATIAVLALVAIAALGLVASGGRTVTATGGSSAIGGDVTHSHIDTGGAKP